MKEKQQFALVIAITIVSTISLALPYPILSPLFLSTDNPINSFASLSPLWLLGISMAAYPLGLFFGSQYLGDLSDQYGRRPIIVISLLLASFLHLICGLSIASGSFLTFITTRFFTGMLEGNIAVARAIVSDRESQWSKPFAFAMIAAAGYLGWFVGPILGGLMVNWGYPSPFYLSALLTFSMTAVSFLFLKESCTTKSNRLNVKPLITFFNNKSFTLTKKESSSSAQISPAIKTELTLFLSLHFLLTLSVNLFYEFYPVYQIQQWQATPWHITEATMVLTFFMVVTSTLILSQLLKRTSSTFVYSLGALILALSILSLSLPHTSTSFTATIAIAGCAIALYNGVSYTWFSTRFSSYPQGKLMGALVATFCLSNITAALGGSWLAHVSLQTLFVVAAVVALISGSLFAILTTLSNDKATSHATSVGQLPNENYYG